VIITVTTLVIRRILKKRYQAHLNGTASKFTRSFKPLSIVFHLKIMKNKALAMKIERDIKKLSRKQKEDLIAIPIQTLKDTKIFLKR
jgi:predicted GIY-YIG superfamily endonuclease